MPTESVISAGGTTVGAEAPAQSSAPAAQQSQGNSDNGSHQQPASAPESKGSDSHGSPQANAGGGNASGSQEIGSPSWVSEIERKFRDEGYKPTAEENTAYVNALKNRGAGKGNDGKGKASANGQASDPNASQEQQPSKDGIDNLPEPIKNALKEVGAKDVSELPEKVKGLRAQFAQAAQKSADVQKQSMNLHSVFMGFLQGDAKATEFVAKNFPEQHAAFSSRFASNGAQVVPQAAQQPASARPQQQASAGLQQGAQSLLLTEQQIEAMVDPDVGRLMNNSIKLLMDQHKAQLDELRNELQEPVKHYKSQKEKLELERADAQVMDEVHGLVNSFPDFYDVPAQQVKVHLTAWLDGADPDPSIKGIVDTIAYANEKGIADLETAHKLRTYNDLRAGKGIKLPGRNELGQFQPSNDLAGRGGNHTVDQITESDFQDIEAGRRPIPQGWFKDSIPQKGVIPPQFYQRLVKAKS